MGNKTSSEVTQKGKKMIRRGKGRAAQSDWKRTGKEAWSDAAPEVRSNPLSSKFLPRAKQQTQLPDLENGLQLSCNCARLRSDSAVTARLHRLGRTCGVSELQSQRSEQPLLSSSLGGSRSPTLSPVSTLFPLNPPFVSRLSCFSCCWGFGGDSMETAALGRGSASLGQVRHRRGRSERAEAVQARKGRNWVGKERMPGDRNGLQDVTGSTQALRAGWGDASRRLPGQPCGLARQTLRLRTAARRHFPEPPPPPPAPQLRVSRRPASLCGSQAWRRRAPTFSIRSDRYNAEGGNQVLKTGGIKVDLALPPGHLTLSCSANASAAFSERLCCGWHSAGCWSSSYAIILSLIFHL
nr:ribonuclease P protein subunit p38 isoform X2 [Equus asinus]